VKDRRIVLGTDPTKILGVLRRKPKVQRRRAKMMLKPVQIMKRIQMI
jgi:hypothetical protein